MGALRTVRRGPGTYSGTTHGHDDQIFDNLVGLQVEVCIVEPLRSRQAHADGLPESYCSSGCDEEEGGLSPFGCRQESDVGWRGEEGGCGGSHAARERRAGKGECGGRVVPLWAMLTLGATTLASERTLLMLQTQQDSLETMQA
jgi:hypothetical protein